MFFMTWLKEGSCSRKATRWKQDTCVGNLLYHLHVQMQKLLIISGQAGKSLFMCIFSLEVIYWLKDAMLRNPLVINEN
jgi:hypothetical protein